MVAGVTLVDSDQEAVRAASQEDMTIMSSLGDTAPTMTSMVAVTMQQEVVVAASREDMVITSSPMTSMETPVDPSLALLIRFWVRHQTFCEVAFTDIIRFTGGLEKAAGKVTKKPGMAERGADRAVCQPSMIA